MRPVFGGKRFRIVCPVCASADQLENINDIFARMEDGRIDGRIVVNLQ